MATPRKHWFRVADSILREPISVEQRGMLVGLMAYLNQRWARDGLSPEEACRALASQGALKDITGRSQLVHARSAMRLLSQCVSLSIREVGEFTEIYWPKWAEFQRLQSEPRASTETLDDSAVPPPQDAPARRKTQDAKNKTPRAARAPSTLAPEELAPEDRDAVKAWRDRKHPEIRDQQLRDAWEQVYLWSHSKGKTAKRWRMAFMRYLDDGWPLRANGQRQQGFESRQEHAERMMAGYLGGGDDDEGRQEKEVCDLERLPAIPGGDR